MKNIHNYKCLVLILLKSEMMAKMVSRITTIPKFEKKSGYLQIWNRLNTSPCSK